MSRATAAVMAHAEPKTSVRWKIFLIMLLLVTVNYIDRASLSVAMPMIASEFTLTPVMQGLIMSSFFWSYTLMQIPGGMAVDRFKPRLVLALCTLLWGAFQGLGALTTNAMSLLATRLGLGVAEAPVASAGGALNAMWLTQHERVRGASLMDGGSPLGAALGSVLITWLIVVAHSWRAAFAIAGVGTVLCGVGAWYYIKNQPRDHAGVNEAEAEYIELARRKEDEKEAKSLSGNSLDFFRYRSVLLMFVGFMCCTTLYYGLLTWMPTYLQKVQGFNIQQMGGASFVIFFSGFHRRTLRRLRRRQVARQRRRAKPRHAHDLRYRRRGCHDCGVFRGTCNEPHDGCDPAVHHALLSALGRSVLVDPRDARLAQQGGRTRRSAQLRWEYRRHGDPDRDRRDRSIHRLLFPCADVFRRNGRRPAALFDRNRL